eukprot:3255116-Amphidinium_carterae.1
MALRASQFGLAVQFLLIEELLAEQLLSKASMHPTFDDDDDNDDDYEDNDDYEDDDDDDDDDVMMMMMMMMLTSMKMLTTQWLMILGILSAPSGHQVRPRLLARVERIGRGKLRLASA